MSATRDKSQKITFVYSNLYSIYRKGVERAREGAVLESGKHSPSLAAEALLSPQVAAYESGAVLKARNLRSPQEVQNAAPAAAAPAVQPRILPYTPAELIGKRLAPRPASLPGQKPALVPAPKVDGVAELKKNLEALGDLQARLRFMLKELEDLIKE